jgi:hypothetical protein
MLTNSYKLDGWRPLTLSFLFRSLRGCEIVRVGKLILLAVLALAGCESAAERIAADNQQCLSYGFTMGTDAFAQCRLQLDIQRNQLLLQNLAIQQLMAPRICNTAGATMICN